MSPHPWPFPLPDRAPGALDVVCVGNAIVDRFAETHDGVVIAAGLEPGVMTLVDAGRAAAIEHSYGGWAEVAGGSAANTAAGIASLGGAVGFVGAVGLDAAGRTYVSDLEAIGVHCVAPAVSTGTPTGVSHIFVEEGGRRTMATFLGAGSDIATGAVDAARVGESSVVYLEGYLLDAPNAAAALARATEVARSKGTVVSLSLSDPFVVERHHDRILGLIEGGSVDLLFGNEDEAFALTGAQSLQSVAEGIMRPGFAFVVTRGPGGSAVLTPDGIEAVEAAPVDAVVDTTGAGDLFAAGVLYGLTKGESPQRCLWLGSLAAGEVISHIGARPRADLASLAAGA